MMSHTFLHRYDYGTGTHDSNGYIWVFNDTAFISHGIDTLINHRPEGDYIWNFTAVEQSTYNDAEIGWNDNQFVYINGEDRECVYATRKDAGSVEEIIIYYNDGYQNSSDPNSYKAKYRVVESNLVHKDAIPNNAQGYIEVMDTLFNYN